ncbi:MAG: carboxymuconolactone decarboxylase family protein, partial [Myxococcota bacterium]|nr:carboxymuconolactone decarboxylase family protein [Myxococcota bacterium]
MTAKPRFPKPTFTASEMTAALLEIAPRFPRLLRALWGDGRIDPVLRETVLLAVADALGCRWCRAAHAEIARAAGVPENDIGSVLQRAWADLGPRERAAVVSALRRVGSGVLVDASIDAALEEHFGAGEIAGLAALVDAVRIAALSGNTVDMLLGRLRRSTRPRRNSTLGSEAAVAALWA